MSKLSDYQKNMILLYERSNKDADGWATVSDTVWPLVEKYAIPEMFEIQGRRIRLTEAGKTILAFAL